MKARHSVLAALRVDLASTDERRLAFGERNPSVVCASNPATARKREKDLTEPGFVGADHAARLKVDDVRVSFALALGKLDRRDEFYIVRSPTDCFCQARGEAEDLHRRIVSQERPTPFWGRNGTLSQVLECPLSGARMTAEGVYAQGRRAQFGGSRATCDPMVSCARTSFASGSKRTGRVEACVPPQRLLLLTKHMDQPFELVIEATLTAAATNPSWSSRMPLNLLPRLGGRDPDPFRTSRRLHHRARAPRHRGQQDRGALGRAPPCLQDLAANIS